MKLYSIYKNLFESYDHLITEELLDEVKWESSKESKLRAGEIPLTPSIVKFILGEHKKVEAFHVMGIDNIDGLRSIIRKRNTISAFKFFEEHNIKKAYGIQTTGGIVTKISGYLNIIGAADIMSTVDPSLNRRWISANLLSSNMHDELTQYFRSFNFSNTAEEVKTYITKIFQLLDKYHVEIQGNLFKLLFGKGSGYGWNELLVRNIEVSSVAWLPEVAIKDYYEDEEREKYIQEITDKLKTLTPNVYTFSDGDELLKWFKENGGHVDFSEFVKSEFKNYKREDFLNNIQGISTLLKFDPNYIFENPEKITPVIRSVKDNGSNPYSELMRVAEQNQMLSVVIKLIFKANGKDWDNMPAIQTLIDSVRNRDFNKWLIDFYGVDIKKGVINAIVNSSFDEALFRYLISKVGNNLELLVNIIQNSPKMLKLIDKPSEDLLIAAVSGDGLFIENIDNPSEAVKLAAVRQNGNSIDYIENPSEEVQLAAVQQRGSSIGWLYHHGYNPSEAVKLEAVKQDGAAIRHIKNPSDELIFIALKHDGRYIKHINNPSERVQMVAVKNNGIAMEYIENPTEAVQIEAIKQNAYAIGWIRNPSEKVQMLAVSESPSIIEYIRNPSEAVQMHAIKNSLRAIYRIDKPTKNVLAYYWTERVKEGHEIDDDGYDAISDEVKYFYITSVKNRRLTSHQLYNTPDKLAMIYLQQRLSQGWSLNNTEQARYDKLKSNNPSLNETQKIIKNILRKRLK